MVRCFRTLPPTTARHVRYYMETGRFSEPVPFLDMLTRQIAEAGHEGLTVQRVLPELVRLDPPP